MTEDREFVEKLRSIGFSTKRGTSDKRAVLNETDGTVSGYETRHWDDSQDVNVTPKSIAVKIQPQGEAQ